MGRSKTQFIKKMKKTVEPTGDLCVKFTDEELAELGIKIGDKFSYSINEDGSVSMQKYVPLDVDISEWSREVLEMLIKESVEKDISVNDVICDILEKQLEIL